jgi:glycosyltransferase involved in cell wall biosynthesis
MRSTLVVIPALNERATVGLVVERVRNLGYPVVVIDDGSEDDTTSMATRAGATVVKLPVNLGVGGALRTGFRYAVRNGFDRVVVVDADLQHPPESIPILIAAADDGHDLVIGSRFDAGYESGTSRRLAMRLLASWVSRAVGTKLDDVTSGFRVISEPLLSTFAEVYPTDFLADTVESIVYADAAGARICQVPVEMNQRVAGAATSAPVAATHLARLGVALVAGRPRELVR